MSMIAALPEKYHDRYKKFREFVTAHVEPHACEWDFNGRMPESIIDRIAEAGYFGALIPEKYGGKGWDFTTFGLLNEAFGRGSSSLTVLFTVQNMVAASILKWGTPAQINRWIRPVASGELIAAFAITEPNVGSDISAVATKFTQSGDKLILSGTKTYITFAGIADIYLVFGYLGNQSVACVVEKKMPGVRVTPIKEMLGFKSCHLARLDFDEVEISMDNIIGKPGFGISHVAPVGLHCGRLSTAFSSAGLVRACLEASISRASRRKASGKNLDSFESVRNLIAEMGMAYETSLLHCLNAARACEERSATVVEQTIAAKYAASKSAVSAAGNTIQICGAFGCNGALSPVSRYYRDARIMEIIEGTSQVLQGVLGTYYINTYKQAIPVVKQASLAAV
jgi:alkylation response protein AidB-like acyl-CoA dehydrogenase